MILTVAMIGTPRYVYQLADADYHRLTRVQMATSMRDEFRLNMIRLHDEHRLSAT